MQILNLLQASQHNPGDGNRKSWLHEQDQLPGNELNSSFNSILYKRVKVEDDFSESSQYATGERVYKDGFVYEATTDLQAANWNGSESNSGDLVFHNNQFFRLPIDLNTSKVDDFSSVDADHIITQPISGSTTGSADSYKPET